MFSSWQKAYKRFFLMVLSSFLAFGGSPYGIPCASGCLIQCAGLHVKPRLPAIGIEFAAALLFEFRRRAKAFGDVITSVLSEVAGDSKEAMVFMKLLALAQAGINLGVSISEATKGGAVAGPIGIATNVGAVIVAFAQVMKSIKAAQVPAAPKFETGGVVGGTSFTGDKIPIRVNSGEMILNKTQQTELFNAIASGNLNTGNQYTLTCPEY